MNLNDSDTCPEHFKSKYKIVISAITYCIAAWGTASDSHMDELDTLHAKAAKIIYNILRRTVQMKRYYKKLTGNQLVTCINEDCKHGCIRYTMRHAPYQ